MGQNYLNACLLNYMGTKCRAKNLGSNSKRFSVYLYLIFIFLWSPALLQESAFPAEQVSVNEPLLVFTRECLKFPFTFKENFVRCRIHD